MNKNKYSHPYQGYFPHHARAVIIGTAPPHRFCTSGVRKLSEGDIDFFYGSFENRFWPVMKRVFEPQSIAWLKTKRQCTSFLQRHSLGIDDIIQEFYRNGTYAGDENLEMIKGNSKLIRKVASHPQIEYAYFTSHEAFSLFCKCIYGYFLYLIEDYQESALAGVKPSDICSLKLYDEAGNAYRKITLVTLRSPSPRGVNAENLLLDYQEKFAPFIQQTP
jgi:G:T/U-mismatch repair DNA glycosylase